MSSEKERRDEQVSCNSRICCTVENCVYHDGDTKCTAKAIDVGPHYACCCQDTACATFKQEKQETK